MNNNSIFEKVFFTKFWTLQGKVAGSGVGWVIEVQIENTALTSSAALSLARIREEKIICGRISIRIKKKTWHHNWQIQNMILKQTGSGTTKFNARRLSTGPANNK